MQFKLPYIVLLHTEHGCVLVHLPCQDALLGRGRLARRDVLEERQVGFQLLDQFLAFGEVGELFEFLKTEGHTVEHCTHISLNYKYLVNKHIIIFN